MDSLHWQDSELDKEIFLTRTMANKRAAVISDVSYKLALAIAEKTTAYFGHNKATFTLSAVTDDV